MKPVLIRFGYSIYLILSVLNVNAQAEKLFNFVYTKATEKFTYIVHFEGENHSFEESHIVKYIYDTDSINYSVRIIGNNSSKNATVSEYYFALPTFKPIYAYYKETLGSSFQIEREFKTFFYAKKINFIKKNENKKLLSK